MRLSVRDSPRVKENFIPDSRVSNDLKFLEWLDTLECLNQAYVPDGGGIVIAQ